MRRCLFRRAYARLGLAVDGVLTFRHRNGLAEDSGNLALLELAHLAAAGARCRHILALDIGDGKAILVVVAVLEVPAQVGRLVRLESDTTGGAGDRKGPNIAINMSDRHKNLRPFKGK